MISKGYIANLQKQILGNISISIPNKKKSDLRGSYIRTVIENNTSKKAIKDFPIKASIVQTDVQFFPESGNMINGILSMVAFKVTGVDGIGLIANGKIIDNQNNEIASIETLNFGTGSFPSRNLISVQIAFFRSSFKFILSRL
ncbi:MAG: hypothetical protein H7069_14550 [Phormidesmis sp. FL-bin-119]|nr:hypothetical protein [Pedobacter sp.]